MYPCERLPIKQSLTDIKPEIKQDPKKLFFWLWRNWSSQIQQTPGNQLEALWDLLPADTRIPDHSIWAHQALTSAIAAAKSNPAFLLFTISPVQAFINAARRTQDLWAGSYSLSYLNWAAIESIVEEIGPDAVIFPNLIGQPLCDRWLFKQGILPKQPKLEDLVLPSLPNRFLAIVPYEQSEDLAKLAAERMRSQWRKITQKVRESIEGLFNEPLAWGETWERQTENLFETYWQIYPWIIKDENANRTNPLYFVSPHEPYLGSEKSEKIKKFLQIYTKPTNQKDGKGQYPPNIGAIYSSLYFITEKALGSRKGLRNFKQIDETGEKSTLSGERAAVYDGVDNLQNNQAVNFDHTTRKQIRTFWNNLAKKLQNKGRYEIQAGGKERLDAVELTKRCSWRSYFEEELRDNNPPPKLPFPSTYSVASATFKNNILTQLLQPGSTSLREALNNWVDAVYPIAQNNLVDRNVIPFLSAKVNHLDVLLHKFLCLDGRLLYIETYHQDSTEFSETIERSQIEKALNKLQHFLKVAKEEYNISKPRKYFAVLMMDGDEMGKWLSGDNDNIPKYEDVLHPTTKKALDELKQEDWKNILDSQRLISPAIHGFISKALGDFSLKLVRHIVEKRYPGKLVYAGGDDVFALLPLDSVLEVARELRAAFSGEIFTGEIGTEQECQEFEVEFNEPKARTGYIWLEQTPGDKNSRQLLATMGHKATASTGIAIVHYKNPLDVTLAEVRKAEKAAKSQEGRNAFSLTFIKRSGEIMNASAKWNYAGKSIDTIKILLEFKDKFARDNISSKFPYVLRETANTLSMLENKDLYRSEIKRLLARQQGTYKLTKAEEDKLAGDLAELVMQANQEKNSENQHETQPRGKLKTFADLLIFTRFLATEEGEEE